MIEISRYMVLDSGWSAVALFCALIGVAILISLALFVNDGIFGIRSKATVVMLAFSGALIIACFLIMTQGPEEEHIRCAFTGEINWDEISQKYDILSYEDGVFVVEEK